MIAGRTRRADAWRAFAHACAIAIAIAIACGLAAAGRPAHAQETSAGTAEEAPPAIEAILAPPGASAFTRAFFEVCAAAIDDVSEGYRRAIALGWAHVEAEVEAPVMPPHIGRFMALTDGVDGATTAFLHLSEARYPDATTRMCMMQAFGHEDGPMVNVALLDAAPGFTGGFGGLPNATGMGRWSRMLGGDLVTFDAMAGPDNDSLTLVRIIR